jgi:hypothetical protein
MSRATSDVEPALRQVLPEVPAAGAETQVEIASDILVVHVRLQEVQVLNESASWESACVDNTDADVGVVRMVEVRIVATEAVLNGKE